MSKYNEVMENLKVSEDMRERILKNVEKELESGSSGVSLPDMTSHKKASKVVEFRKYAGIAAAFAILIVGAYAVNKVHPFGGSMSSSTMTMDSKTESAMEEITEMAATETADEDMVEEAMLETTGITAATENAMSQDAAEPKVNYESAGNPSESLLGASGKNSSEMKEYASLTKLSFAAGTHFKEIQYLDSFSSSKDYYLYNSQVAVIRYDVEGNAVIVREMDAKKGTVIPEGISGVDESYDSTESITAGNTSITLKGLENMYYIAQWSKDGLVYELESSEALTLEDMTELMEQVVK